MWNIPRSWYSHRQFKIQSGPRAKYARGLSLHELQHTWKKLYFRFLNQQPVGLFVIPLNDKEKIYG